MKTITALTVLCSVAVCSAFTTPTTSKQSCNNLQRYETATDTIVEETTTDTSNTLDIPLTYNEMINQVSQCMSDAYEKGNTRQIVRILLPRDAANDQFGIAIEAEADTNDRNSDIKLVPTDESWQESLRLYCFIMRIQIHLSLFVCLCKLHILTEVTIISLQLHKLWNAYLSGWYHATLSCSQSYN